MRRAIKICSIFLLAGIFLASAALLAGEWSTTGYGSGVGCTEVIIPAGARNVTWRMTITDDDDNYDLYVYFPTRTDCSTWDCRPARSSGWTETCGPYNPFDYDPSSTCGDPDQVWRFKVEEVGYCYGRWNLYVTWTDCNVGNDCSTPNVVNLPADLAYLDRNQWTTGRSNNYSTTCLGTYDAGEDIMYRLNVNREMIIDITLDPKTTAGTAFALANTCPPGGTCIAQSTNSSASPHSVTEISLSTGTYYLMVDSDGGSIPDFDLLITAPSDCDRPAEVITVNEAALPITLTQQFTCGRVNNYTSSCLGSFDGGEDIIFEVHVTETVFVDILLGNMLFPFGTAILIDDECPPTGDCLYYSRSMNPFSIILPYGIYDATLEPGTYYIMVDVNPDFSDCIESFSLTIQQAEGGANCDKPYLVMLPGELPYSTPEPSLLPYRPPRSTENKGNNYSSTCLGDYDGGNDVIYMLDVYSDIVVDIELEPMNDFLYPFLVRGSGMVLHTSCPAPSSGCLSMNTRSGSGTHSMTGVYLRAEDSPYYLMLDSRPDGCFFGVCLFMDYHYVLRITENLTPPNPPNPNASSEPCGPQILTRSGTPYDGIVWYWQGTSCGTRTDLGSGETFTAGSSGTYYIRAYNTASGEWSDACGSVTVTVNPWLPVSVTITADPDSAICVGESATFTASPVNPGSSPSYQWRKNGVDVGDDSPTYTDPALEDGDEIVCILTSSEPCATDNPATSNLITVRIYNDAPVGVWTGYADFNWTNPLNWGQCTPPTATTDAIIPSRPLYARFPIVDTDDGTCVCKNIILDGTLNGDVGNLHVYGEWINNGTFNCGTGTITFIGTGEPAIGGRMDTEFYYIVAKNIAEPIDLRRDAGADEIDLRQLGGEGIDLRGGEEIDLR